MARDRLIARRKALGFTQQSLAYEIGCQRTTVARWERDECEVSPHHREPLAQALHWSPTVLDQVLNGNNLPQPEQGWWSNYEALEQSATSILTWEPTVVPGLLQTPDYASALLDSDELVARRLDRQRLVTRPNRPADLIAVIDESVLHRPIGGPGVLEAQIHHLASMAEHPNISVSVLPFDAPAQPASWGAFLVLRFPWPGGLVYLEHKGGARSLDSPGELGAHLDVFDHLRDLATPIEPLWRMNE